MSRANRKFDLEKFFVALSDRNRLRLINLMGDDEVCVCFFVEILKMPQPRVSRHLAYLRRAGIVEARREGKWMHYQIVPPPDEHAANRDVVSVAVLAVVADILRSGATRLDAEETGASHRPGGQQMIQSAVSGT